VGRGSRWSGYLHIYSTTAMVGSWRGVYIQYTVCEQERQKRRHAEHMGRSQGAVKKKMQVPCAFLFFCPL
jgi:hypothetical protein